MARKDKSSKRKCRENDSAIANGVDSEAIPSKVFGDKDGVGVMDDLNEPTMGEKLASLNLIEESEDTNNDFVDISRTKPPTVDSVYILLNQAHRADDQALIIDCLKRQDEQALQLSSCLDILYASTFDDGEEDTDKVTPVIFEDNDDSDDEGSQYSMETESVLDGGEPQVYGDISDNEDTGAISD